MPFFAFAQIEIPWALGPPDGRYLVRDPQAGPDSPPTHVLLVATLGAPERRRLARRRRAAPPEPEPTAISTGRATVISAEPLVDAEAAARWLATSGEPQLADALAVLDRALHAFRVVTFDPYEEPLARERLLVARLGYGEGEEVAYGRWTDAVELLPSHPSRRRSRILEPQVRLAGALGARIPMLICEELALRARRDLDRGRSRTAALQLRGALDAALAELASTPALSVRVEELRELQPAVVSAADAAALAPLTETDLASVTHALSRLEAALRARAASSG